MVQYTQTINPVQSGICLGRVLEDFFKLFICYFHLVDKNKYANVLEWENTGLDKLVEMCYNEAKYGGGLYKCG